MLQKEIALDDVRCRLGLCQTILTDAEDGFLFGIVALTPEYELLARRLNLHHLTEAMHIPNNLLEIRRWHRNNTLELDRGNGNGSDIQLNEIQGEMGDHLLLTIHDFDSELRGVRLPHEQNDALIVAHRLHEFVEVNHVQAQNVLLGAVELVKAVGLETQMNENRVRAVHRHDFEARAVEFQVGVRQDILDGFDEGPKRSGFDSADAEKHVRRLHSN